VFFDPKNGLEILGINVDGAIISSKHYVISPNNVNSHYER